MTREQPRRIEWIVVAFAGIVLLAIAAAAAAFWFLAPPEWKERRASRKPAPHRCS